MTHSKDSRLASVRTCLEEHGIDGVIVPITNAFQGEYSPACDQRLQWLTGFTGSNGMAIVLRSKAAFFTDGRYTLQAQQEVGDEEYALFNMADVSAPKWLKEQVQQGAQIGYDGWLHTQKQLKAFQESAQEAGFSLKSIENIIDPLWTDRPEPPAASVRIQAEQYTGKSSAEKRQELANELKKQRLDAVILSAGDSICWLLNIRGSDIPHTPFLLAYAIAYKDASVDLFYAPEAFDASLRTHLGEDIRIRPFTELTSVLEAFTGQKVMLDPARVSYRFFELLKAAHAETVEANDPCQLRKSIKNEVELHGARKAHIRDGVAVSKFLHWFDTKGSQGQYTELDAVAQLTGYRAEDGLFQETSFETISGYGPNGAIIHYRVSEESNLTIEPGSLYLVDSGGQYLDGTTDITRTLPVGDTTQTQKEHFTRVLKGMIQLSLAQFPKGTTGIQLDVLARQALWQVGLDYNHGTGHGIGSYLSVHEGPQGISTRGTSTALEPGMLISNEPGYYLEGSYGIRIENVIAVTEKGHLQEGGKLFYGFETLTLAPIHQSLIDATLLTSKEKNWLNTYHQRVYDTLAPLLDEEVKTWLQKATQPLSEGA